MITMRVSAAALTVTFGVMAAPAMAADPMMPSYSPPPVYSPEPIVTAQVQIYGGIASFDGDSATLLGGRGSVNFVLPHLSGVRTQVDIIGNSILDSGYGLGEVMGLAHFYKLNEGSSAYGVFVGGGDLYFVSAFIVGAEMQHFWGPITFGADVAYWNVGAGGTDLWSLSGTLAYYLSENTRVQGRIGYFAATSGGSDFVDFSAQLAHRYAGTPFGAFGEIGWTDIDGGDDVTRFLVGLNVDVDGGGSRLSHDRSNTLWQANILSSFF